MNARLLIIAAAALTSLAAAQAQAQTQTQRTYYMRERVAGLKPAAAATPPAPTYSCTGFRTNSAPGDYAQRYTLGTTTSSTTALALCRAKIADLKVAGICAWNSSTTSYNAGWPPMEVNYVTGGRSYDGLWTGATASALNSSDCTKS